MGDRLGALFARAGRNGFWVLPGTFILQKGIPPGIRNCAACRLGRPPLIALRYIFLCAASNSS